MAFTFNKGYERFESLNDYIGFRSNTNKEHWLLFYYPVITTYIYTINILINNNIINKNQFDDIIYKFDMTNNSELIRYNQRLCYTGDISKFTMDARKILLYMHSNNGNIERRFERNIFKDVYEDYSLYKYDKFIDYVDYRIDNMSIHDNIYIHTIQPITAPLSSPLWEFDFNPPKYQTKFKVYMIIDTNKENSIKFKTRHIDYNIKLDENNLKIKDLVNYNRDREFDIDFIQGHYYKPRYGYELYSYIKEKQNSDNYGVSNLNNKLSTMINYLDTKIAFDYYIKLKRFPAFLNNGIPYTHHNLENSYSGIDLMRITKYSNMYRKEEPINIGFDIPSNGIINKTDVYKLLTILYGYDVQSDDTNYDKIDSFIRSLPTTIDLMSNEFNTELEKWYYNNMILNESKYDINKKYTYYKNIMIEDITQVAIIGRGEFDIKLTPIDSVGDLNMREINLLHDANNQCNSYIYCDNKCNISSANPNNPFKYYRFAHIAHDGKNIDKDLGVNSRCFIAKITSSEPVLFVGGVQVLTIDGPIPQFTEDYRKDLCEFVKKNAWDIILDEFYDINKLEIGSLIHQLFAIHQPYTHINFCFDIDGSILKYNREFYKPIKEDINRDRFETFLKYNVQHQPRKNPYIYLTKVNCYAANIAENFNSLTDEMTFIGPMVDNNDIFINDNDYACIDTWLPHVNYGAKGIQAEVRHILNITSNLPNGNKTRLPENNFRWKHMPHNRWYVTPHRHTRLQYDMTNAHFVGTDMDNLINDDMSWFINYNYTDDIVKRSELYKYKYHRMKYHIMSPEYAYTQNHLILDFKIDHININSRANDDDKKKLSFRCNFLDDLDEFNKLFKGFKIVDTVRDIDLYVFDPDNYSNHIDIVRDLTYDNEGFEFKFIFENKDYDPNLNETVDINLTSFTLESMSGDPSDTGKDRCLVGVTGVFPAQLHKNSIQDILESRSIEVIGDRLLENISLIYDDNGKLQYTDALKINSTKLETLPITFLQSSGISQLNLENMTNLKFIPEYFLDHIDTLASIVWLPNQPLTYLSDLIGNNNDNLVILYSKTSLSYGLSYSGHYGTKGNLYTPSNDFVNNNLVYLNSINNTMIKYMINYNNMINTPTLAFINSNNETNITDMNIGSLLLQKNAIAANGATHDYFVSTIHPRLNTKNINIKEDIIKYTYWLPNYYSPDRINQLELLYVYDLVKEFNPDARILKSTFNTGRAIHMTQRYGLDSIMPPKRVYDALEEFLPLLNYYNTDINSNSFDTYIHLSNHTKCPSDIVKVSPSGFLEGDMEVGVQNVINIGDRHITYDFLSAHTDAIYAKFRVNINDSYETIMSRFINYIKDKYEFQVNDSKKSTYGLVSWINTGVYTALDTPIPNTSGKNNEYHHGHFIDRDTNLEYEVIHNDSNRYDHMVSSSSKYDRYDISNNKPMENLLVNHDRTRNFINNTYIENKAQVFATEANEHEYLESPETKEVNDRFKDDGNVYLRIGKYLTEHAKLPHVVAKRGERYISNKLLRHMSNVLMVYDYQKLYESSYFDKTDSSLEYYGVNSSYSTDNEQLREQGYSMDIKDRHRYTEIVRFPNCTNISRRDISGMVNGLLVPPILYTAGSNMSVNHQDRYIYHNSYKNSIDDGNNPFLGVGYLISNLFNMINDYTIDMYNPNILSYDILSESFNFAHTVNKYDFTSLSHFKMSPMLDKNGSLLTVNNNISCIGYYGNSGTNNHGYIFQKHNIVDIDKYMDMAGYFGTPTFKINYPTTMLKWSPLFKYNTSSQIRLPTFSSNSIYSDVYEEIMKTVFANYTRLYKQHPFTQDQMSFDPFIKYRPNLNSTIIESGAFFHNYKLRSNIITPMMIMSKYNTINETYPHHIGVTMNASMSKKIIPNDLHKEKTYSTVLSHYNRLYQPYNFIFSSRINDRKVYENQIHSIGLYANEEFKVFNNDKFMTNSYMKVSDNPYGLLNIMPVLKYGIVDTKTMVAIGKNINNDRKYIQPRHLSFSDVINVYNLAIINENGKWYTKDLPPIERIDHIYNQMIGNNKQIGHLNYQYESAGAYMFNKLIAIDSSTRKYQYTKLLNTDYYSLISSTTNYNLNNDIANWGIINVNTTNGYLNWFRLQFQNLNGEYYEVYNDWYAYLVFKEWMYNNTITGGLEDQLLDLPNSFDTIYKLKNMYIKNRTLFRYKTYHRILIPFIIGSEYILMDEDSFINDENGIDESTAMSERFVSPNWSKGLTQFHNSFNMFGGKYNVTDIGIYTHLSKYENVAMFQGQRLLKNLKWNTIKFLPEVIDSNSNIKTVTSLNSFYRYNYVTTLSLQQSRAIAGGIYNVVSDDNDYIISNLENTSHMYDINYMTNSNETIDAFIKNDLSISNWRFSYYDYIIAKHMFKITVNNYSDDANKINIFSNLTNQNFVLAKSNNDYKNGTFSIEGESNVRSTYIRDMFNGLIDNSPNDNDKLKHVTSEYILFGTTKHKVPGSTIHSLALNDNMLKLDVHSRKQLILDIPDSTVVNTLTPELENLDKYNKLTGLISAPSVRSVNMNSLDIINYYKFEQVENGRRLDDCEFEIIPIVESGLTYQVESLIVKIDNTIIYQTKNSTIDSIIKSGIFTLPIKFHELREIEFEISSNVYNWVIRVIPEEGTQNDISEPVVTIGLPFVSTNSDTFTLQGLTRKNTHLAKHDIPNMFIESYEPNGDNIDNIVPFILIFGRIKEIPTNIFEQVRSNKLSTSGITLYSTLAGSHVKSKWNIDILTPLRKTADLFGVPIHGIGAWMFRLINTTDNDFTLTNENSWINTAIEGESAISGDFYEFLYGKDNIPFWTVIDSIDDNDIKDRAMDDEDVLNNYINDKMSNQKDHIIPLLFANCGNENGYTVDNNLFKKYYEWCLQRNLSDPKVLFVGMFAGSYITSVTQYLNGVDINTKLKYNNISEMPVWSASELSKGCILWDHKINSMTTHGNLLNPDITKRPHLVFMGYLPNDFTYAFCPLLIINTDTILESYTGINKLEPMDKINPHFINHRGQFINCKIDGILDISRLLETYKNGTDIHVLQLSFAQFPLKKAFYSMISRLDSSLNNVNIQQYANKIIDISKYIKVNYIEENGFSFNWFNSVNENMFKVYADYMFFGRAKLLYIKNKGTEYMDPYSSYRRCFMQCINLKQVPSNLIPVEHIMKDFRANILGFIEMFNGSKTYVPLTFIRNPSNVQTGYILNTNVTHSFKDCYFIVECDPNTMQPIENLNGLDIKLFGRIEEVTTPTISIDKIRSSKSISDVYHIVFKEYIGHPQAADARWAPFFHTRLILFAKIPKNLNR